MHVRPLLPERSREAAHLLADAFRDYPVWRAIGPRHPRARWRMVNRFYRGALARAHGAGVPLAAADPGALRGVAITYPAERWPPPVASFFHEAWGVVLSGPGAAMRGLRSTREVDGAHPTCPHDCLHTIGVDPGFQRRGAGNALLEHLIAAADERSVPIHLTTSSPENLPYYRRFGFEVDGERSLARGVPLWSMLRRVAASD